MKKIILASGIFYPEVGGPAIHVRHIAEKLVKEGWNVHIFTYSSAKEKDNFDYKIHRIPKNLPKLARWFLYFIEVLFFGFNSKLIYTFDVSAAGLPSFLASKILHKKLIVRIGGDPIWERIVENGKRFLSMEDYYEKGFYIQDKPKLFKIVKMILNKADRLVTYTKMLVDMYEKYYEVPKGKFTIIKNPFLDKKQESFFVGTPTFVFAGRFVLYKNLELVIRAFNNIRNKKGDGELILIGSGPEENKLVNLIKELKAENYIQIKPNIPQTELFNLISNSSVCLAPALTEFNPNFILECLSFGKPVIITRGNGLSVDLPERFLFSANSQKEFEDKIERLFDKKIYEEECKYINKLDLSHNWKNVVNSHLKLIRELL